MIPTRDENRPIGLFRVWPHPSWFVGPDGESIPAGNAWLFAWEAECDIG